MVQYAQNELLSITDFTKGISGIIKDIKSNAFEKIGILKNNKLEAVVISTQEYERLKEAYDILEHIEIYKKVQERENSKTISLDESMKRHGIKSNEL